MSNDPQRARDMYHEAALAEFKTMRDALVSDRAEQNKIIGLVMGSLPVAATVYTLYVSNAKGKAPIVVPLALLFLGSAVYSVLVLYMLHFYWNMRGVAAYLKKDLLPRIEDNMRNVGGPGFERLEQPILWGHRVRLFIGLPWPLVPISWSSFVVPLLPAVLLAWRGWTQTDASTPRFERSLGYGAVVLLAYCGLAILTVASSVGAHQKGTTPWQALTKRLRSRRVRRLRRKALGLREGSRAISRRR